MISISENLKQNQIAEEKYRNYELQLAELFEQLGNLNTPNGWTAIDATLVGGKHDKEYNVQDYLQLRAQAFVAYRSNPYARSIINNLVNYVVGAGVEIKFDESNSEDDLNQLTEFWDEWTRTVKWRRKQRESIKRAFRDGEAFVHLSDFNDLEKRGFLKLSFLEPDWVASNNPNITHGIETDPIDVEEVISYRVIVPNARGIEEVTIPPEEVVHIKQNTDGNVKRGRSELECVLPWIEHKNQNLQSRTLLNKFRTNIVAVRKLPGAKQALAELRDRLKSTQTGTSGKEKMPPQGSIVTIDSEGGADLEFKSPQLGSTDAEKDDRMLNLFITAGVQLPEFVVTADASNANFASTRTALITGRKRVEEEQSFFNEEFQEIFRRVVIEGKRAGLLNESVSDKCEFEFPVFDMNDFKEQVEAFSGLLANALVSKETASASLGFNFEDEMDKIDNEFERDFDDIKDPRKKKEPEDDE